MSDVSLSGLKAEEVLVEERLPDYRKGMEFFHLELSKMNARIFILDHVVPFPFHLLSDCGSLFFRFVFEDLFNACLLTITRMTTDSAPDLFTLQRFKNDVLRWTKPMYSPALQARLRVVRFDANRDSLARRAQHLRDERLAHNQKSAIVGGARSHAVSLRELKTLEARLRPVLDALSFDTENVYLPLQYLPTLNHPPGFDPRPDIEVLLDLIARDSSLLNLPETNPDKWQRRRRALSETDIFSLNRYRKRFGLSEV